MVWVGDQVLSLLFTNLNTKSSELMPGQVGLINHGGLPKLLLKPGRYPGLPFRNWIARTYVGARAMSETVIEVSIISILKYGDPDASS